MSDSFYVLCAFPTILSCIVAPLTARRFLRGPEAAHFLPEIFSAFGGFFCRTHFIEKASRACRSRGRSIALDQPTMGPQSGQTCPGEKMSSW